LVEISSQPPIELIRQTSQIKIIIIASTVNVAYLSDLKSFLYKRTLSLAFRERNGAMQPTFHYKGFSQTLQTPFSLIVPTQLPSLHNFRSDKSGSSNATVTGFPHQQQ
jgi:hypothetical protein